jgi:cytochrome c
MGIAMRRCGTIAVVVALAALPSIGATQAAGGAASTPRGVDLFKQRCAMCHSVTAGKVSPLGPNLAGVVGRRAGTTSYAYSAAMKSSGLVWTRPVLDRYLSAPAKLVPGTKMAISVPDSNTRTALIDYLATTK